MKRADASLNRNRPSWDTGLNAEGTERNAEARGGLHGIHAAVPSAFLSAPLREPALSYPNLQVFQCPLL